MEDVSVAPRRPPSLPIVATCLCGALATARSETGRYFCAEHLPRRGPVPPVSRPAVGPDPVPAAVLQQPDLFE